MTSQKLVSWEPEYHETVSIQHPIKICQTASMACIQQVSINYTLKYEYGKNLSTFQLETVMKIVDCILKNKPFLLGDGTGVGKGRVLAAVVRELGLKTVWISSSLKLEKSAIAELCLVMDDKEHENVKFASYTSIKYHLNDIIRFMNENETFVILDECHQLRNCSKTKKTVDKLLNLTKKICYSSATIASSIKHLRYLEKIGLWGLPNAPFMTWEHMEHAAKSDAPAFLELVSLHLCRQGQYVCRQLDTKDVSFEVKTVPVTLTHKRMYETCARGLFDLNGRIRQQFFLRLIVYMKVDETIKVVEELLKEGKSVVISVSNTGEATIKRSKTTGYYTTYFQEICDEQGLDLDFKLEPIDIIINYFGKENVAEITGRKLRPVPNKQKYERIPKTEVENFQKNKKRIAILSRAGGMGLSLHDSTGDSQRVHIILEIPWSGEDFLQQMGRIYRSNAKSLPTYIFMVSEIPSEYRTIMSVLKKLKNMGAIVKADRSAYEIPGLREDVGWSSKVKGNVGLQLALASKLEVVGENLVECDLSNHKNVSFIKNQITRNLCIEEEENNDCLYIWNYNTSLAKCFFPSIYYPLKMLWSPGNNHVYCKSIKKRILYFLLCAKASHGPLGWLPDHLLLHVVSFIADVQSLSLVKQLCEWTHINFENFSQTSSELILNDSLCMPIDVQHLYINLLNSHTFESIKNTSIKTINNYAENLIGTQHIKTTQVGCKRVLYNNASHKVKIKYEIVRLPKPPPTAEFWHNDKRVVWKTSNGDYMSADGGNCIVNEYTFQSCTIEKWNKAIEKKEERLVKICNQSPTTFYIATNDALNAWEGSLKRTIRFKDETGNSIVGVLVGIMP